MITFSVSINGRALGVAGAHDMSVLTAIVTAVGRLGPGSAGPAAPRDRIELDLRVGGMTAPSDGSASQQLDWVHENLRNGDQIVITVADNAEPDRPSQSRLSDTEEDSERQQFEYARETYFRLREKFESSAP